MFTVGIFPFKENSHGRAGNRTRDLMISSQRLWPLDHEAGQILENILWNLSLKKTSSLFWRILLATVEFVALSNQQNIATKQQ